MKNHHPKTPTETLGLNQLAERFPGLSKSAATAARYLLGNGREHLVQEVTNDVLLALWSKFQQGDPPQNPEAWVRTVAWNRAAKVARLEGKYAAGLLDPDEEPVAGYMFTPASTVTPASEAELSDRLAATKRLLAAIEKVANTRLTPQEALVFELVYKKRLTGEQVAFELQTTPEVVRKQWSRLVTKLLDSLRLELQQDPLCKEVLASVLGNEKTCRRNLVNLLRVVMRRGVEELENLVRSAFDG